MSTRTLLQESLFCAMARKLGEPGLTHHVTDATVYRFVDFGTQLVHACHQQKDRRKRVCRERMKERTTRHGNTALA